MHSTNAVLHPNIFGGIKEKERDARKPGLRLYVKHVRCARGRLSGTMVVRTDTRAENESTIARGMKYPMGYRTIFNGYLLRRARADDFIEPPPILVNGGLI